MVELNIYGAAKYSLMTVTILGAASPAKNPNPTQTLPTALPAKKPVVVNGKFTFPSFAFCSGVFSDIPTSTSIAKPKEPRKNAPAVAAPAPASPALKIVLEFAPANAVIPAATPTFISSNTKT